WSTRYSNASGHDPTKSTFQQFFYGNESNDQGQQPNGPYLEDLVNDGEWHRFTYALLGNTAAGSRDGFARMWIDGVKIIDVSQSAVGVTPPGGFKQWCDQQMVDWLRTDRGIDAFYLNFFGGVLTHGDGYWQVAYDINSYRAWSVTRP